MRVPYIEGEASEVSPFLLGEKQMDLEYLGQLGSYYKFRCPHTHLMYSFDRDELLNQFDEDVIDRLEPGFWINVDV